MEVLLHHLRELRRRHPAGYTAVEALIVAALITTLFSVLVPNIVEQVEESRESSVASELAWIAGLLTAYEVEHGHLPDSLDEILSPVPVDPWGNPYQYLRIRGGSAPPGHWRKDRFLVPLNSDFDLYSMGPDGRSSAPLTAQASRDDIVRAGDGSFIGVASEY